MIADKNYRLLMEGVRKTLEYNVEIVEEEAAIGWNVDSELSKQYRVMSEAVGIASRKPLFAGDLKDSLEVAPGIPIEYPKEWDKGGAMFWFERNLLDLMKELLYAYDRNPGYGTALTRNPDPSSLEDEMKEVLLAATKVARGVLALKNKGSMGDPDFLTPPWMEPHVDAYIAGKWGQEGVQLRKAETDFMEAQLKAWKALEDSLETLVRERERRQKIVEFGVALQEAYDFLGRQYEKLKKKTSLEEFFKKLKAGEVNEATAILEKIKKSEEAVAEENLLPVYRNGRGKKKEGTLDLHWSWAVSGFYLDHLVRLATEEWITARSEETLGSGTGDCRDLLTMAFLREDHRTDELFKTPSRQGVGR
jgi:hypothetical protein